MFKRLRQRKGEKETQAEKRGRRKERRAKGSRRNVGRAGGSREGAGRVYMCVRLALAGGEIARVRLAGRVCLCLAEEGCESKKALTG